MESFKFFAYFIPEDWVASNNKNNYSYIYLYKYFYLYTYI